MSDLNTTKLVTDEKRKSINLKLKKDYPLLYWALNYHRNTRGEELSFSDAYYLLEIYRNFDKWENLCIEKSVQMGLSELFVVASLYEAAVRGMTIFYVLPKYESRNRFVSNRVDKIIRHVPHYRELVKEAKGAERLALKHFGNGTLSYVGSNVETEFLEIPVDSAYVDEKDRCVQMHLNMIPDRLSASPFQFYREISNPTIEGFGIDERYQISTKSKWYIKCESCNEWFSPDFFQHVIIQTDTNIWEARDKNWNQRNEANLICPKCGKAVNRLKSGEWIDEYVDREWKGLQISRLLKKDRKKPDVLSGLIKKWLSICTHAQKTQLFYNSDLGLPYSAEGAKLNDAILNRCQEAYVYPVNRVDVKGQIFMGIDVGADLTVVIRERLKEQGEIKRRLLLAKNVSSFEIVKQLIREWQPKAVVIDANPEIHVVMTLKDDFKQLYASQFSHGQLTVNIDKEHKIIKMDRTALLDSIKESFDNENVTLPQGAEHIEAGNYYKQLKASTRILLVNEKNPEKSYFSWEHSSPDHFFLAEAYCKQADDLIPITSIVDVYDNINKKEEEKKIGNVSEATKKLNMTEEEILRLQSMTPQQYLDNLQKKQK